MIAEVTVEGENKGEVRIPIDAFEITFEAFSDWQPVEAKFVLSNREGRKEEAVALLTEAVAVICGNGVHNLPFSIEGDNLGGMIDGGYRVGLRDEVSVLRLYAHLVTVMRKELEPPLNENKLPDSIEINHGGKTFEVNHRSAVRIATNNPLTAGEVIETMEYNRRNSMAVKSGNLEASTLDFTLGLSVFAILCKQKGERLPAEEGARDLWIKKRRELLATISMADVMRVRFFLLTALRKSTKQTSTGSSAKVRQDLRDRRQARRRKGKGKPR